MGFFNDLFNGSFDNVSSRQSTITNINGEVVVNGKHYKGKNVTVINGDVYIDGVKQDNAVETSDKEIKIEVHGSCGDIKSSGSVRVEGDSGDINSSGSVHVGNTVKGNIVASGSVQVIQDVHGDIRASGSVMISGNAHH